ncbi:hypothetical protein AURDEDRAFT_131395 [Auricularia subglabra TFB-10046 SS5]|uniref:Uncharacterized protein n=1 Tax=Auricularia subglabra (strain TFB-10046 / SS5) TaxID=717982 RepID=J0D5G3_AURST|nr:hypothetical protein AURDEDRAFT_131395 [Auricularia subglabra TFB-10046 SS5]
MSNPKRLRSESPPPVAPSQTPKRAHTSLDRRAHAPGPLGEGIGAQSPSSPTFSSSGSGLQVDIGWVAVPPTLAESSPTSAGEGFTGVSPHVILLSLRIRDLANPALSPSPQSTLSAAVSSAFSAANLESELELSASEAPSGIEVQAGGSIHEQLAGVRGVCRCARRNMLTSSVQDSGVAQVSGIQPGQDAQGPQLPQNQIPTTFTTREELTVAQHPGPTVSPNLSASRTATPQSPGGPHAQFDARITHTPPGMPLNAGASTPMNLLSRHPAVGPSTYVPGNLSPLGIETSAPQTPAVIVPLIQPATPFHESLGYAPAARSTISVDHALQHRVVSSPRADVVEVVDSQTPSDLPPVSSGNFATGSGPTEMAIHAQATSVLGDPFPVASGASFTPQSQAQTANAEGDGHSVPQVVLQPPQHPWPYQAPTYPPAGYIYGAPHHVPQAPPHPFQYQAHPPYPPSEHFYDAQQAAPNAMLAPWQYQGPLYPSPAWYNNLQNFSTAPPPGVPYALYPSTANPFQRGPPPPGSSSMAYAGRHLSHYPPPSGPPPEVFGTILRMLANQVAPPPLTMTGRESHQLRASEDRRPSGTFATSPNVQVENAGVRLQWAFPRSPVLNLAPV